MQYETMQKPPVGDLPQPGNPFSKGLIGVWPFSEGTGDTIRDASGFGNHLTIRGIINQSPAGGWVPGGHKSGEDGETRIKSLSSSKGFSDFTLGIYIRTGNNVTSEQHLINLITFMQFGIYGGKLYANLNTYTGPHQNLLSPGKDYFCAFVRDSLTALDTTYLDAVRGSSIASYSSDEKFPITLSDGGLWWYLGYRCRYLGVIYCAWAYERVLSQAELTYLCAHPLPMFDRGRKK